MKLSEWLKKNRTEEVYDGNTVWDAGYVLEQWDDDCPDCDIIDTGDCAMLEHNGRVLYRIVEQ